MQERSEKADDAFADAPVASVAGALVKLRAIMALLSERSHDWEAQHIKPGSRHPAPFDRTAVGPLGHAPSRRRLPGHLLTCWGALPGGLLDGALLGHLLDGALLGDLLAGDRALLWRSS